MWPPIGGFLPFCPIYIMFMTTAEAKAIIAEYIRDWTDNFVLDYVKEGITDGSDEEALEAYNLVGFDFDWNVDVTVS